MLPLVLASAMAAPSPAYGPLTPPARAPMDVAHGGTTVSSDGDTDLFLLGLGLIGLGLAAGGAGFAILEGCNEKSDCYTPELEIVGWVLAAPGILPLGAGLFLVYLTSDSSASREDVPSSSSRYARGALLGVRFDL